jgi:uncharacterized protein with ParB-like and HNH nuclease domain
MSENNIGLKSTSDLFGMNFFIPSYQRGYRWTQQQVRDLLEDIWVFRPAKDEWYCLQPLVVKKRDNESWEVIDGQQRLTTIFLVIHYFNEMWIGKQKIEEPVIAYETRTGSTQFLKNMKVEDDDTVRIDDLNIDYQHISTAYQTIHNWVKEKNEGSFDNNDFQSKFKEKTKVIWYETDIQDSVEIFTRINMGKIPLTNAELIKALFLNSSNFKTDNDKEKIRLKQLKIASEWDFIEYSLQNEEFWWFINKEENEKETRIEFLFELIVGEKSSDEYHTFREYYKNFKGQEQGIENNWKIVKRYFQLLQDWFENRDLYHKIGFLVSTGEEIKDLIGESLNKNKVDFLSLINDEIKTKFGDIQLSDIEYGNKMIRPILLLYNIQTMLNNEKENSRFPFNRYKKEKWDIEHIHAIATAIPKTEQHQKDWLKQAKEFLDDNNDSDLLEEISQYSKEIFESLFEKILNRFSENGKYEDMNDLANLTLLDIGTNRSYKNAVFPVKRKVIIDREKEGTFVPICTKNVFMKYYSPKIDQMTFWGEEDRTEYINNIKEVLGQYLINQEK